MQETLCSTDSLASGPESLQVNRLTIFMMKKSPQPVVLPLPAPSLAEWQSFHGDDGTVVLDRATLLDILATTDAPWGYIASLSRPMLLEHLQKQEMKTMKQPSSSSSSSQSSFWIHEEAPRHAMMEYSPRCGRHRPTKQQPDDDKTSDDKATTICHESKQLPFPLGPAPVMMRTNPWTGLRQAVARYTTHNAANQYTFGSTANTNNNHHSNSLLLDQSFAEIMLRLHPLLFLTLYQHEKAQGRMGVCGYKDKSSGNKSKQKNRALGNNMHLHHHEPPAAVTTATDSIVLGGVSVGSRALVCGLARSYALGWYQQWTMEQILCYQPYCICPHYHAVVGRHGNGKNDSLCTRHHVLMSWNEIQERQQTIPPVVTPTSTTFVDSPESSPSRHSTSTGNNNNKSPDTMHTISTITTSASSEIVYHQQQQRKSLLDDGSDEEGHATALDGSPLSGASSPTFASQRKHMVDSSSSHPLRAPYRPTTSGSVCSQSHSSATLMSHPKSFWPHAGGGGAVQAMYPPVKQLGTANRLLEPVAVRAVSSDSLEFVMLSSEATPTKRPSPAPVKQSTNQHGCSTTMAMYKNHFASKSAASASVGGQSTGDKAPAMPLQLQWNNSSTTLPVSNRLESRFDAVAMEHAVVDRDNKAVAVVVDISFDLNESTPESSMMKSDGDELDTATESDIDSQATQCSAAMERLLESAALLEGSSGSLVDFDDVWVTDDADIEALAPTSPLQYTRSAGSTVKSGSSGIDSTATQCSSPVSVVITIDQGKLVASHE